MSAGGTDARSTHSSFYSGNDPNNITSNQIGAGGERVSVAMRLRPMMPHESQRNDNSIISVADPTHVHLNLKSGAKQYRFNAVLPETTTQMEVFQKCGVNELIDSALEGYSATIFAYGQTGSGKTYTMMGKESTIAKDEWSPDQNDGLFLQSVRYMWEQMTLRNEQFYVKSSFLEIYNE